MSTQLRQDHLAASPPPWSLPRVTLHPNFPASTLRILAALPIRAGLHTYHRLQIVGRGHLPLGQSFIMVANHASHLDAFCLLAALPLGLLHRAHPVADRDYFFGHRLAPAALLANAIPFARGSHLRAGLQRCRAALDQPGSILIFFPEGTRTLTGDLGPFRSGIGALVAGTHVPVVPCALSGTFQAWPKRGWFPRPHGLKLVIGAPRRFGHLPAGRQSNQRIAAELRAAVQELPCP